MRKIMKQFIQGRSFWVTFFVIVMSAWYEAESQRVVSLTPSVTELIVDMGCSDVLVGRTSYCPNVNAVVVGDILSVNMEKVVSLKPDIVICVGFVEASTIEKMQKIGINVKSYKTPRSFDEMCRQTIEIGCLIGVEDKAESIVKEERRRVEELKKKVVKTQKRVLFQIGTRPIFSVVDNTYTQGFIDDLGLINVSHTTMPSREYVVSQNPDYVILTTMGGLYKEESKVWQKLIKARIIVVDENMVCSPTPTNYRKSLEVLFDEIYGQ